MTGVLRAVFHTLSRKVHSMRVQRMEREAPQMGPESLTGFCPPFKEENTNIVQTPSESKAERILPPFPNHLMKSAWQRRYKTRKSQANILMNIQAKTLKHTKGTSDLAIEKSTFVETRRRRQGWFTTQNPVTIIHHIKQKRKVRAPFNS